MRCVAEVSVGGRAPACGAAPAPFRLLHYGVVFMALLLFVLRRTRACGWVRWRVLDALSPRRSTPQYAPS